MSLVNDPVPHRHRSLLRRWRHRRRTRATIETLRGLDDHMLRDIGVARGDIAARVRGQFDRP